MARWEISIAPGTFHDGNQWGVLMRSPRDPPREKSAEVLTSPWLLVGMWCHERCVANRSWMCCLQSFFWVTQQSWKHAQSVAWKKNGISWENMGMILNFHLPWSPWTMIIWLKYVTTCNPSAKQTEGCARCRYIIFFSKGGNCPNMNCLRPIRRPNHQISSPAYKMKQGGQQGRKEPIGQSLPKKCGWLVVWNINYWEFHHPKWLSYFSEGWPNHQPGGIFLNALEDQFQLQIHRFPRILHWSSEQIGPALVKRCWVYTV